MRALKFQRLDRTGTTPIVIVIAIRHLISIPRQSKPKILQKILTYCISHGKYQTQELKIVTNNLIRTQELCQNPAQLLIEIAHILQAVHLNEL